MLSRTAVRSTRQLASSTRPLSTSCLRMAEGDTGAPRAAVQSDAFSKREKAAEDKAIHDSEMAKLKALRQKLTDQQKTITDLVSEIDATTGKNEKK